MKHFYTFLSFFFILTFASSQTTIGFEIDDNWNPSPSGYGDYGYTEGDFTAYGISILRESAGNHNDFPKTFDLRSVRLKNNSTSSLTMIISNGGISEFSFKVRRWDGSPATNFIVETTTDNGGNWNYSGTIDATFTDDNDWKTFSGTINSANSDVGVRVVSQGSTERIMIDNFTWTGFSTSCSVIFGQAQYSCEGNSIGDSNDFVTVSVPYTGLDAGITSLTTTSGGSIGGDNPATTADGTIVISGVSEGSGWDLVLNGGDCDGISTSGTIEVDFCDPIPNTCYDLSNGNESFELVAVATNSDSDAWVNNSGTYTMNGYCGSGCSEISDTWLVFGPLDTTQTSDLTLAFNAAEQFGITDLVVAYTEQYGGCPALSQWITAATISDAGAIEVDFPQINGSDVYIGIQYYEDGTDGSSGWTLTDVALNSFGNCPTLGTVTPSDCATCDVSLDTAVYTCNSNTVGDNNDGVIITIPYTGSEPSLSSITTSSAGNLGGDDPAQTADGNIILSGLNEGDSWDIILNGGDCDGTTISGTVPAAVCDPVTQDLIINEILADPAGDITGDSNGDGTRDGTEDEFIEFYNTGSTNFDLSGYVISDGSNGGDNTRHTFEQGTIIPANSFLVVFGGGTPTGFANGTAIVSSSGALGLNNSTDSVILKNASGNIVVQVDYTDGGNDQSVGRSPDFTGEFVLHTTIPPNALFSPGLENDDPLLSTQDALINMFKVYPNPSNTGFVNIKSNQMGAVQAQVFDMLGKQIINTTVVNERLKVSSLNAGIYIVKLTQNDRTTTKKLILQ
jgi:hypothetical protein